MSNYVVITNYLAKDSLVSGNPGKIVKGADLTNEFNAIATMSQTKYDAALIAGTSQILFANGTAGSPSIAFNAYPNTGLYAAGANSLGFSANGVAAGSISNAGNWVIPAPSSGTALTASATANQSVLVLHGSSGGLYLTDSGANGAVINFYPTNTGSVLNFSYINGWPGTAWIQVANNNVMGFASTGAVTINAPSASGTALTLNPSLTTAESLILNSNGSTGAAFQHFIAGGGQNSYIGASGSAQALITGMSTGGLALRSDTAVALSANGGSALHLNVSSAGAISGYGATAAGLVDMTPDTGTFTATLTGCTTSPTGTCKWSRTGNVVMLHIPAIIGTSNSVGCTFTGLPAAIQPATTQSVTAGVENAGGIVVGSYTFTAASGTVTMFTSPGGSGGFTNSATSKGTVDGTVCYVLN